MEPKKSKYDTNPLDPDFVRKTEEVWIDDERRPETKEMKGATREMGSSSNEAARESIYSEAPTRRYDNATLDSTYPSVFVPPQNSQPAPYQQPGAPFRTPHSKPTSRTVAGLGLPEKWAMILPYMPFFIGVVLSLVELFLVPKREGKIRFHASQGLALHVAIIVGQTLFGVLAAITDSNIGGNLFGVAATVFLIISMIRVWKGEPHYIAPIAEPAQWLNQHITSRTK